MCDLPAGYIYYVAAPLNTVTACLVFAGNISVCCCLLAKQKCDKELKEITYEAE